MIVLCKLSFHITHPLFLAWVLRGIVKEQGPATATPAEPPPRREEVQLLKGLLVYRVTPSTTLPCHSADWMTDSLSLHFHPSLHLSSKQPPTPDPPPNPPSLHRHRHFRQHLFDLAALYS